MKTATGYYIFRCEVPIDRLPELVDNLPETTKENVSDLRTIWNSFMYPLPDKNGNVRIRLEAKTIRRLRLEEYVTDPKPLP